MTVIVRMRGGDRYRLDRRLRQGDVAAKINAARASGELVEFETDATPTGQMVWLDPAEVAAIENERSGW